MDKTNMCDILPVIRVIQIKLEEIHEDLSNNIDNPLRYSLLYEMKNSLNKKLIEISNNMDKKKINKGRSIKIIAYNDNERIEFDSITCAKNKLNQSVHHVRMAIKNKTELCGFYWKRG